jgi:hypothetical protein
VLFPEPMVPKLKRSVATVGAQLAEKPRNGRVGRCNQLSSR